METKLTKIIPSMVGNIASEAKHSNHHPLHAEKNCCGDCKGNGLCRDVKINHENLKSNIDIAPKK